MKMQKKLLLIVLVLCILTSCATIANNPSKKVSEEEIIEGLKSNAEYLVKNSVTPVETYEEKEWVSKAATFPSKFDLRDQGYVPEVRDQAFWGTCWGFASIGASEISILADMKLTTDEYAAEYGREMDLSEKHLAWFASTHLPLEDNNINNQFGEGVYLKDEDALGQEAHYQSGGTMGYASTNFSAAMGPVWESDVPYAAADGSSSTAGDWTLPESMRFNLTFEIENSSALPSPAQKDEEGNYVYNPMATEAFKRELLEGRAVTIGYHADQAMDPESMYKIDVDYYVSYGVPEETARIYMDYITADPELRSKPSEAPEDFQEAYYIVSSVFYEQIPAEQAKADFEAQKEEIIEKWKQKEEEIAKAAEETTAEDEAKAAEEAAKAEADARSAAKALGFDYNQVVEKNKKIDELSDQVYINTDTYAQYTDNNIAPADHSVCIVGWDDDYDVSNFNSDHIPPANGAWIIRNSWGKDYGNDGYFYLSYYDQTILVPETFDFDVTGKNDGLSTLSICAYDMMPAELVKAVKTDSPVYTANVFEADGDFDLVLSAVSVMTAAMNSKVTVAVYMLNNEAKSPVDGVMLDTVTTDYEFAGYHKINLHQNYLVPNGKKISVVQLQRTEDNDVETYAVPFTIGTSKEYMELTNKMQYNEPYNQERVWRQAVVNRGESFISLDCGWKDWADVLKDSYDEGGYMDFVTIDNIGIKAYLYKASELEKNHNFGSPVSYCGSKIRICQDCGYTIVSQK